jgi:hypothetical protein
MSDALTSLTSMAPDAPATVSASPPLSAQNAASQTASAKRLQVSRACDRCKRLRRGCSEYRPCQRCLDAGQGHQCWSDVETRLGVSRIALDNNVQSDKVFQQLTELLPAPFLDSCTSRFFDRLYPTIPILTPDYITRIRTVSHSPEDGLQPSCILLGMCAQVLLQTDGPEDLSSLGVTTQTSLDYGHLLLEKAGSIWQSLPRNTPVTIELCLFAFFLYACEAVLSHHSRAFRYLRETATLLLLHQGDHADEVERLVSGRLFWVLLISERSHAIRYKRPITLHITEETPSLDVLDPSLLGFLNLAELFRPLNTSFIGLLNQDVSLSLSPAYINDVEGKVNSAIGSGFGLYDTQKTNLRVTQLWLRLVIWKLRLRLGYLVEESYQHSITFRYPIDIAKELMLSTRDLPMSSFIVHGVGMIEKLFDIASALVDVLARVPVIPTSPSRILVSLPVNDLAYLRTLIQNSPGGDHTYDDLLEKHIQQTIPSLATRSLTAG